MNKSTFFSGQPIFTQLLKFVSRESVVRIAQQHQADRYSKRFNTYEHLVTMLYSIFNNCNSLREVATGMLASEQRLRHIGIRFHPRRSTISDANNRLLSEVYKFENKEWAAVPRYSKYISFKINKWAAVLSFPNNGTRATQDIIIFESFILLL